jgi:hypothetical protein
MKMNLLRNALLRVPKPTVRALAVELKLSVGVVHKYMGIISLEKKDVFGCSVKANCERSKVI